MIVMLLHINPDWEILAGATSKGIRMHNIMRHAGALAIGSVLFLTAQALAQGTADTDHAPQKGHDHGHSHSHDTKDAVYNGYFEDDQVKPRALGDWEGEWQSVYPYLADGTLDPVIAAKAAHGDKSADEYRAYYETGYRTDVDRIVIDGASVSFSRGEDTAKADYAADGHEILTYEKGNRGVRYIFRKIAGDDDAPLFIQFSDHAIAPKKAGHYHLYWGDDRAALLKEVSNWPTYYPSALSADQIVQEMLAH